MYDRDLLIDLFYKSENYFFKSISKHCLSFQDVANAYLTGVNASTLNPLSIRKIAPSFDTILLQSKELYDTNECSWEIMLSEYLNSESIEHCLHKIGFHASEKSVGMFMELSDKRPFDKNNLPEIKEMNHHLTEWGKPLIGAFESTPIIINQYIETHERALSSGAFFYHFTAYENRTPVSSITISINQKMVRIDDVGTDPTYQKKGYGTHLMNYALSKASELGATHCFLEASDEGLTLYQKLGFISLFKNHIYSKK